MAQMEIKGAEHGKRTRKQLFVDLTPMVDLAFLLISFFMLTTVLQENKAIKLNMPETEGPDMAVSMDRLITLIANDNNRVWYYYGDKPESGAYTNLSASGVRYVLYQFHDKVISEQNREPICLIKFTGKADYNSMVGLLDEMDITDYHIYAIQDLTESELAIQALK